MALTYEQFIRKHNGKAVDYDGVYGAQCVDLIKCYLKEVFNISAGSWGDAKEYYTNFTNKSWGGYAKMNAAFVRIKNTPTFVPAEGDICVYGADFAKTHNCGHIGIAAEGSTVSRIKMYDQNSAGNHDACKLSSYGYTSKDFLGVLRPIKLPTSASLATPTPTLMHTSTQPTSYYSACNAKCNGIVDGLVSIGVDGSFANRKKIAKANGISPYAGTAGQNLKMLQLLKAGKLIRI